MKSTTLLTAISVLAFGLVAALPANAGLKMNALTQNGVSLNGINVNGSKVNGTKLNGININGAKLNGTRVNGSFSNGVKQNGVSLNGLSKAAIAKKKLSITPEPLKTSINTKAKPVQRELTETGLVLSVQGREQLKYLVDCALPPYVTLYAKVGDKSYEFQGGMGLAPEWLNAGLTKEQEKWISACMFARTNAFGKHVEISMRADDTSLRFLQASEAEKKEFPLFEGGFFGNVFLKKPVAYVCLGDDVAKEKRDPIFDVRVCAIPTDQTAPSGEAVTQCSFIVTGKCSDPNSRIIGTKEYPETIYVYLKPGLDSVQE